MTISFDDIQVGGRYTREELAAKWGYAEIAAISRGVVTPQGDDTIVLFVTRTKRKGDAQFHDQMVGPVLLREGANDHFSGDRLLNHKEKGDHVNVFYSELHKHPFTYIGQMAMYCGQRFADRPSQFVLQSIAKSTFSDT